MAVSTLRQKLNRAQTKQLKGQIGGRLAGVLARSLGAGGDAAFGHLLEARPQDFRQIELDEVLEPLPTGAMIFPVLAEGGAVGVASVSADFGLAMADFLTGDSALPTGGGRKFTAVEAGLVSVAIQILLGELNKGFTENFGETALPALTLDRPEPEPKALLHRLPEGAYSVMDVHLDIGDGLLSGVLQLALTAGAMQLPEEAAPPSEAQVAEAIDPAWGAALSRAIYAAPMCLNAVVYRLPMRLRHLQTLAPGQVLELQGLSLQDAVLEWPDKDQPRPILSGRIGARKTSKAFLIEDIAREGT